MKPILFNSDMVRAILAGKKTQTRRVCKVSSRTMNIENKDCKSVVYPSSNLWYPSIHMPKEAARIFLRVTNVRVERLQGISHGDLSKEGISADDNLMRKQFREIWDSTTKDRRHKWNANPFVWVIEFERIEKEEEK